MDFNTLAREAPRLAAADQHVLLDRIVDALASTAERQVAEAWDEEIARRVEDLDSGRQAPVPWTEVERRPHARRTSRW
jgi:putative addiction module component (TIGR02574 family)